MPENSIEIPPRGEVGGATEAENTLELTLQITLKYVEGISGDGNK